MVNELNDEFKARTGDGILRRLDRCKHAMLRLTVVKVVLTPLAVWLTYAVAVEKGPPPGLLLATIIALAVTDLFQRGLGDYRFRREAHAAERAKEFEVKSRAEYQEAVAGAFQPISHALARLAAEPDKTRRIESLGAIRERILESVIRLVESATRSAYYQCKDGEFVRRSDGPPNSPRSKFSASDPGTQILRDLLASGGATCIPDVGQEPAITPSPGSNYKAVIAAAVTAGHHRYGVLTVDSPQVNGFKQVDLYIVQAFAGMLGAAIAAYVRPRGVSSVPEEEP